MVADATASKSRQITKSQVHQNPTSVMTTGAAFHPRDKDHAASNGIATVAAPKTTTSGSTNAAFELED